MSRSWAAPPRSSWGSKRRAIASSRAGAPTIGSGGYLTARSFSSSVLMNIWGGSSDDSQALPGRVAGPRNQQFNGLPFGEPFSHPGGVALGEAYDCTLAGSYARRRIVNGLHRRSNAAHGRLCAANYSRSQGASNTCRTCFRRLRLTTRCW